VLGLGAGLGAAFIAELSFRGLTTGEDVETRLGVPSLGGVPMLKSVMKWRGDPINALVKRPHSVFAESFRSLQTSISYSTDAVVQVVVVTSALPREGKSTIAAGLALTAAMDGQRVLLIDCDLRRRSVNRMVPEPPKASLIDVLRGDAKVEDALVQDAASGAWILPLNSKRVDPGDYFVGEPFRELLNELRGQFTYIVLDTAPVLPIADTRVLATLGDAVIFVARWRKTADDAVRSALRLLPRGRVNLTGVVLSQIDVRLQARFGYGDPTYYYSQYKEYYS
jgi:succinoglycan biosynthesis transport protein ExoP